MKTGMAVAGLALLALAVPATAAEKNDGAEAESTKRICRVQGEIGTRFKKRVCATAKEWAQMDEISAEARKNVDKIQQQRSIVGN